MAVSPNGKPTLPVKWNLILTVVMGVATAVLAVLSESYPDVHAFAVAWKIALAVGIPLGISSAGIRGAAPLLLALLLLPSCTTLRGAQAWDCIKDTTINDLPNEALSDTMAALNGTADPSTAGFWGTALLNVAVKYASDVPCLLKVAEGALLDALKPKAGVGGSMVGIYGEVGGELHPAIKLARLLEFERSLRTRAK
jgi:hypothetical protein